MSENPYDKILDYLFIDDKIDMIVICTKDSLIAFPDYSKNCIRIPVADDPQESNKFIELLCQTNVLEKINNAIENKENVLVACYLIKYHDLGPEEAINYIRVKRRIAFFGEVNFISAIKNNNLHK